MLTPRLERVLARLDAAHVETGAAIAEWIEALIEASPQRRSPEEHAAFEGRLRQIAKTMQELAEEVGIEVCTYTSEGDA